MNLIFDTFKRDELVKFYKQAREVVVDAGANSEWNADFDNPNVGNITRSVQFVEFPARIWWTKEPSMVKSLDGDENVGVKVMYPIGSVRIQVKQDAKDYLSETVAFYIKNERYVKDSDWRGVGMLGAIDRYEIVLKKDQ